MTIEKKTLNRKVNESLVLQLSLSRLTYVIWNCNMDKVKFDMADQVGEAIMVKMDEMTFANVVLKKADQIKTMSSLDKKSKVNKKNVVTDKNFLFNRLLVIMARTTPTCTNLQDYFRYELTIVPTALFTDLWLA
jgi:hypothetical protein